MIGKDKVILNLDTVMHRAADKGEPFGRSLQVGNERTAWQTSGFFERNFRETRLVRCGNVIKSGSGNRGGFA